MAAFTQTGFNGAMMQMFNHGTITAMLFILVGVIYDRAHTREIDKFGGMATQMPMYAAFFGFAFMASLGLPGLSGFIGEVLVFLGAFPVYEIITILAARRRHLHRRVSPVGDAAHAARQVERRALSRSLALSRPHLA